MNGIVPFLKGVGNFVNRNRNKIVLASVVAVAVGAYLHYNYVSEEEQEKKRLLALDQAHRQRQLGLSSNRRLAYRSRVLLRIKKQFEVACRQFLPILRSKIVEAVDIQGTIKHIKELRAAGALSQGPSPMHQAAAASSQREDLEGRLWGEIKNGSFVMFIVTAYMLAAVCTLLKVQLHVLARSMCLSFEAAAHIDSFVIKDQGEGTQSSHVASSSTAAADKELLLDTDTWRTLIEGTYQQLLGDGLLALTAAVKQAVAADPGTLQLSGWRVKEKTHVEYEELCHAVHQVRQNVDSSMEGELISTVFIPMEAASLAAPLQSTSAGGEHVGKGSTSDAGSDTPTCTQTLLYQTWDLLESPAFQAVYAEAVDCSLHIMLLQLRDLAFLPRQRAVPQQPPQQSSQQTPQYPIEQQVKGAPSPLAAAATTITCAEANSSRADIICDSSYCHDTVAATVSANAGANSATGAAGVSEDADYSRSGKFPASPGSLLTPPLATLLPQVKAVASALLPATGSLPTSSTSYQSMQGSFAGGGSASSGAALNGAGSDLSPEVRQVSSGPYLEAFCIAIFDSP